MKIILILFLQDLHGEILRLPKIDQNHKDNIFHETKKLN